MCFLVNKMRREAGRV
jgi:hypothetical protein